MEDSYLQIFMRFKKEYWTENRFYELTVCSQHVITYIIYIQQRFLNKQIIG